MLGYEVVAGYFDQTIAKLKEFEGCVPWMYRDTVGRVTVGVGLMLPNEAAACELPFLMAAGPANLEQIAAEFDRVDALPPGKAPAFYKTETSPELPPKFIDTRLSSKLTEVETTLRERLPYYEKLPDMAKMALLDMAYNLGPAGLLMGYPHMLEAIELCAWSRAAAESEREGIGAERNAWTRLQFLSAVVDTIRAGVVAEVKAEARSLEDDVARGDFWGRLRRLLSGK
jgi:GH24 family phage-related lysozyme (muramidase)